MRALTVIVVLATAACAPKVVAPPAIPLGNSYPEFVYPFVPLELQLAPGATAIDLGWRHLQNNDLRAAEREFTGALKRNPGLYPAHAGTGYVELARQEYADALAAFDAALMPAGRYVPALVGRGEALLALKRDVEALTAFEAAVAADSSLAEVRRRVEVLRFRSLQDVIDAGRRAATAGRLDEARDAYDRALKASPDSAFLHHELGVVERRRGNQDAALQHLRRAIELDASDAAAIAQMGEILEERQDFAGAEAAYRRAAALEPSDELTAKIAAIAARAREARLPAEFRAINALQQITRGDLAALIGIRFEPLLRRAPARQALMTDVRGHWAEAWIAEVARAGVMEPFENHTFQPRTRVRRGDAAAAVTRLLSLIAADNPALSKTLTARPRIADMNTGHLSYPAAAAAVAAGVMPLLDGDRFQVNRAVSGAEALEIVERLRVLAAAQ